jgi:hypothetical protein
MKINIEKLKILFKNFWKEIIIGFTALSAIFAVVDYLTKWKILFFLKATVLNIWSVILSNFINTLFFLWILILTIFLIKRGSKKPEIEEIRKELLKITKNEISTSAKGLLENFRNQISSISSSIKSIQNQVIDLKRSVIDFEIDKHLSKNQIGAISKMIEKLEMDIKRGWGIEDTLYEIKEYIKNHGMPSVYLVNLNRTLGRVPDDFRILKEEILSLTKEKLYKI